MAMRETPAGPAGGDDIALTPPPNADVPGLRGAAGDTCPTCGGAPGPGRTGRCAACVEGEWATLRVEMGEEWFHVSRHRDGEGD